MTKDFRRALQLFYEGGKKSSRHLLNVKNTHWASLSETVTSSHDDRWSTYQKCNYLSLQCRLPQLWAAFAFWWCLCETKPDRYSYHSIHLPHNDNTIASLVSGAADEVHPVSVYTVLFLFIAGILFIFYSFISLNFTLNLFRFRYKKKLDTG